MTDGLAGFMNAYGAVLAWLSLFSVISFAASLVMVPYLVCHLPRDYFLEPRKQVSCRRSGAGRWLIRTAGNLLGIMLVVLGIFLLFVPGQGLITLFLGLLFLDFPGKTRLVHRLAATAVIRTGLNWIRKKKGVPPLLFPG